MKNEGLKQANMLAKWFDMNDVVIDDIVITIKLKNDDIYKIMADGSIVRISDSNSKAFANANEAILSLELKSTMKDSAKTAFKIILPTNITSKDELQKCIDDMTVQSIKDGFAYLTYIGNESEEPETIEYDIRSKYGIKPALIEKL